MAKRQITNIEVKKNNRNRIFRYLCECEKVSNPDISYELKMSLPTVMQNTKELMERGLVEEVGELDSTGGRRAKALAVVVNAKLALGLDITRKHIGLVLTNLKGEILKYQRIYQPYESSAAYYEAVNKKLEDFVEESKTNRECILGLGISYPGIVNLKKQEITSSHVLEEREVPFEKVSRFFSYPCFFQNDANAGAYAEGLHGKSSERFFYLSLSNTVGGAIFNQDELVQGKNFRCGEVGHMTIVPDGALCYCKKAGCLDAYCAAKGLSDKTDGKLELFFEKLEQGETDIVDIWENYTTYLAVALNNIHMVLDCDIVLGGYVGSYVEPYMSKIWEKVSVRDTFHEESSFVRTCHYKVGAAALGAALKVIELFVAQV